MNRMFMRFSAGLLAFVMVLVIIPPETLRANYQYPVSDEDWGITDLSPVSGTAYNLNLHWKRPPASPNDNNSLGADRFDHRATNYDLFYRNTTKREAYSAAPQKTVGTNGIAGVDGESCLFSNLPLANGSIYAFKVTPWHMNTYNGPNNTTVTQRAPMDNTMPAALESLYLTDIGVTATGIGTTLTVTWDNPTYDGREIFSGYRIYYEALGTGITQIPLSRYAEVLMTDPNLIRTKDVKLEYSFDDPYFKPGLFYAVKVEPLYNGELLRSRQTIAIGANTYQISYTDRQREYRTNEAYIKPELQVQAQNLDRIRLFWDKFPSTSGNGALANVIVYKSLDENFLRPDEITVLSDASAQTINYCMSDYPTYITYYKVIAYYYVPGQLDPITMETNTVVFDPAYNKFKPYVPTVLDIKDSGAAPFALDIIWKAFAREAYNAEEKAAVRPDFENVYIDKNVSYDVWITDDINNLSDPAFVPHTVAVLKAANLTEVTKDFKDNPLNIIGYSGRFTRYVTKTDNGFEGRDITDNTVYYVKIVAVRDASGESSQPAYSSWFIMPYGDISVNPNMMARPPLRIKRDVDGVEVITDKAITIQWDTKWFEAYNGEDPDPIIGYIDNWFSKIGVTAEGAIVFGDAADGAQTVFSLNDVKFQRLTAGKINLTDSYAAIRETVKAAIIAAGGDETQADLLPLRFIDLANAEYEVHVVEFNEMVKNGTYEEYLKTLLPTGDPSTDAAIDALWRKITPTGDPEHPDSEITAVDAPAKGTMQPNTAYAIFFRPYIMRDGKKTAHYPNYVTGTTLATREPIDITPTVPSLQAVSSTDTSVTLWWPYSQSLDYALAFSDLLNNYPGGGKPVTPEAIKEQGVPTQRNGIDGLTFTVTGLFPDTDYYFWIRSIANNAGGQALSDWSNPVNMRTQDITAPDPPKGLGPASKDNVHIYNTEKTMDLLPIGEDYMIIEWMRDYLDLNNTEGGSEPAGGAAVTGGSAELLTTSAALSTYMLKFNELNANKPYYIRAKTVLTVTQNGEDIVRAYNYVVQFSTTDKFVDVVEVTVPPLADAAGDKMRRKESGWSKTIMLKSGKTDGTSGEYDGDKNPDNYPLPDRDFEITYDPRTQTVTYRFRSDKMGLDGLNDNHVDQRLISRLITNKTFTYDIDLSQRGNTVVLNRVVEMPYSVYKALDERKISLRLKTDDLTVTLPPGSTNTTPVKALSDLGNGSTIKIMLTTNAAGTPVLESNQSYATLPQQLGILITTKSRTLDIQSFVSPVKVSMKLGNKFIKFEKNVGAYVADANTGGWKTMPSKYDSMTGAVTMETLKAGSYAAIARNTPFIPVNDPYREAMYTVSTRLNITDMGSFESTKEISASEFNNVVAAVAYNRPSVRMGQDMTDADFQSLGKAKLLVSGIYVSRETGINTLVKLYELKTKSAVKQFPSVEEASVSGIDSADTQYQASLLKADEIGFFGGDTDVKPKENLTLGQFMYILSIIIEDAAL